MIMPEWSYSRRNRSCHIRNVLFTLFLHYCWGPFTFLLGSIGISRLPISELPWIHEFLHILTNSKTSMRSIVLTRPRLFSIYRFDAAPTVLSWHDSCLLAPPRKAICIGLDAQCLSPLRSTQRFPWVGGAIIKSPKIFFCLFGFLSLGIPRYILR